MDWIQITLIASAYFVAGVVKGATGLGYSTTALPVLTLAVGLHAAMPLVLIPSMSSNVAVMIAAGHFRETVSRFHLLYAALIPGLAAGLALLLWFDQTAAARTLGVVIIAYSLFTLWRPNLALPARFERPLHVPVGLLNGLVNGMTGSQIMPIVPFMMSLNLDPARFVQAVNVGFTLSSLLMMAGLQRAGLLTGPAFLISIAGIVPASLGGWLGSRLRLRLPEAHFRRLVLLVLMALGAALVMHH